MPIYEFKCLRCNFKFEEFFKTYIENLKIICPKCKSNNIKQLISASNIIFRGSGFYQTDYKNKPKKGEE